MNYASRRLTCWTKSTSRLLCTRRRMTRRHLAGGCGPGQPHPEAQGDQKPQSGSGRYWKRCCRPSEQGERPPATGGLSLGGLHTVTDVADMSETYKAGRRVVGWSGISLQPRVASPLQRYTAGSVRSAENGARRHDQSPGPRSRRWRFPNERWSSSRARPGSPRGWSASSLRRW